jgi:LAS superfamily LD-carboxypeptidase LdcB
MQVRIPHIRVPFNATEIAPLLEVIEFFCTLILPKIVLQLLAMSKLYLTLFALLVLATLLSGYLLYELTVLRKASSTTESTLTLTIKTKTDELATAIARVGELEALLTETQTLLQETVDESSDLARDLRREKKKNDAFEEQIEKIGSTVGTLDKLAKTDTELLQKYSKVFFLNEHYMPAKLVEIDTSYLYNESVPKFIHTEVAPFLKDMFEDALTDGVKLWVVSAFRSFDEQEDLKGNYSVTYGSGANAFSADQGYSEHQLGTTLDLTTEGLTGGLNGFETTPAYTWLRENAYKYGFTLSYPKENAYYIFEPWHWRFVGTSLAKDLHTDQKFFYDLDQRKIDEYLISLFD